MSNHNKETEARCPHCYRHYVEGTAPWALYMMRMGHEITNPMYDPRVYHLPEGGMIHTNGVETIAASEWIDYWCIDIPDGWEIYEEPKPLLADAKTGDIVYVTNIVTGERYKDAIKKVTAHDGDVQLPGIGMWFNNSGNSISLNSQCHRIEPVPAEEPKPLPADAKVGDICKRRDGKWVQIDAIRNNGNKWSIFEAEGHSYHESGNSVCSELYHTNLDIISTEPLAAEGSAEWAGQMLKLGCPVKHDSFNDYQEKRGLDEVAFHTSTITSPIDSWIHNVPKTGWQLYESEPALQANEPGDYEPEPQPDLPAPGEPATKCMICNKDAVVDDKTVFLDAKTGKVWHLQCSSDLISGVFASVVPSPQPTFNVGDWVEKQDRYGNIHQDYITAIGAEPGRDFMTTHKTKTLKYDRHTGLALDGSPRRILRKLDPSEVVVHIGCLKGTVKPSIYDDGAMLTDEFVLFQDSVKYATIPLSMLDTPTRSLVEKLLKAQEE